MSGFSIRSDPGCGANGFEEKFALSPGRTAVLKDLIPGTPAFYDYFALHAQNSGNAAETTRRLTEWATRFPEENEQPTLLETRQHFLDYSTNPEATLAWLNHVIEVNRILA